MQDAFLWVEMWRGWSCAHVWFDSFFSFSFFFPFLSCWAIIDAHLQVNIYLRAHLAYWINPQVWWVEERSTSQASDCSSFRVKMRANYLTFQCLHNSSSLKQALRNLVLEGSFAFWIKVLCKERAPLWIPVSPALPGQLMLSQSDALCQLYQC